MDGVGEKDKWRLFKLLSEMRKCPNLNIQHSLVIALSADIGIFECRHWNKEELNFMINSNRL